MFTNQYKQFFFYLLLILAITGCKKDSNYKIKRNHRQPVGDSAHHILSDDKYTKLIVEIQYMTGYEPTNEAIENLERFLIDRLYKPEGIFVKLKEIPAEGLSSYTLDDIERIENEYRQEFTNKKEICTYFLFLDGEYSENTSNGKVLGVAYYNTSMAIFEETVKDLSDGITEPDRFKLETTIINHEFGHILGLVNVGSPMVNNHQDAAHGHHCDDQDCLMYWEAETGNFASNLLGSTPIPELDADCIRDLRANGGR